MTRKVLGPMGGLVRGCDQPGCSRPWPCSMHGTRAVGQPGGFTSDPGACEECGYHMHRPRCSRGAPGWAPVPEPAEPAQESPFRWGSRPDDPRWTRELPTQVDWFCTHEDCNGEPPDDRRAVAALYIPGITSDGACAEHAKLLTAFDDMPEEWERWEPTVNYPGKRWRNGRGCVWQNHADRVYAGFAVDDDPHRFARNDGTPFRYVTYSTPREAAEAVDAYLATSQPPKPSGNEP